MRFLFYSHDGFGLGHTCRSLAIARSLTALAPHASILLACGSDDVTRLGVPDRVEILKLPGLRKLANENYASRHLGVSGTQVRHLRGRLLVSAVESFRPDALLVDKHPFGAGGELKGALAALRKSSGKAVLGLRDILDEPAAVRAEWRPHQLPRAILDHYDSVMVYGQRDLFDATAQYGFPPELTKRTQFCGYVANCACASNTDLIGSPLPPETNPAQPLVLATVGGGEDGFTLLQNFLPACGGNGWRAVAVSGPMMPDSQHARLEPLARDFGVDLYSFVPGLSRWFAAADVVVCMGGYNTITQTLETAVPVICVPRVAPRREQLMRAEAFARVGLLRIVMPHRLSPKLLHCAIADALASSRAELRRRIQSAVHFNGADFAAEHLLALARTSGVRSRCHPQQFAVA